MKIKPIIENKIQTTHTSFVVDFTFDYNVTFIQGDSGTGKSAVFSFLQELAVEDKRIRCFDYLDINKQYSNSIKKLKGKIIIIDNADILLDDALRRYIAFDSNNQYLIIGRNPTGLMLQMDEIYELESKAVGDKTMFCIKKTFD